MSRIAYVDESQRGDFYAMAAIAVPHGLVTTVRRDLSLVAPKGRVVRRHFVKESERERKRLLTAFRALPGATYVCVTTSRQSAVARRGVLLSELVNRLLADGLDRLVFDYIDEDQQRRDRQVLWEVLGKATHVTFSHEVPHSREPMLWIPDAVAWCAGRKEWRTELDGWVTTINVA